MIRAFLYGFLCIFALEALSLVSHLFWPSNALFPVVRYGSPFFGSLITAYAAPHDRVFLGIMIALPAALLVVVWSAAYRAMGGYLDPIGLTGEFIVFLFSLSLNVAICVFGSVVGGWLASRRDQ